MGYSLEEHYSKRPEETLYHYTKPDSLYNIIESKELWLTQIQYLNDSKEFRHAMELAVRELENLKRNAADNETELFETLRKRMPSDGARSFIFSLSEKPDLLSQWRGYCSKGGFSVGFDHEKLQKLVREQGMRLLPCIYDQTIQRKLIRNVLVNCVELYRKSDYEDEAQFLNKVIGSKVYSDLLLLATSLKHPSFKEEKEWRIIGGPYSYRSPQAGYRPTSNLIIPYYKFLLSPRDNRIPIVDIRVGPTNLQKESKSSLEWYLRYKEVRTNDEFFSITNSQIPFRTFMQ